MKSSVNIFLTTVIFFVVYARGQNVQQKDKVLVTVYYETLCPFAKKFIVSQLYEGLKGNVSEYVNLELIPYGIANRTSDVSTNVTFSCQHGPSECYGNLIQACSRDLIDLGRKTGNLGYNVNHLNFVHCFMNELNPKSTVQEVDAAVDSCTLPADISSIQLKNCTSQPFGIQHLIQYGIITDNFQKPLKSVPTIVYNGVFNKQESDNSEKDFLSVLCSKIQNTKPYECTVPPNGSNVNVNVNYIVTMIPLLVSFALILNI